MPKYNFKNKKILIVEDDIFSKQLLNLFLSSTEAKLFYASTGAEAIDFCKKNADLDLVFMDIKLPEKSGIIASNEIRKFNKSLPIIAQTASVLKEELKTYLNSGMNDYITKPYTKEDILKIASKHLYIKNEKLSLS